MTSRARANRPLACLALLLLSGPAAALGQEPAKDKDKDSSALVSRSRHAKKLFTALTKEMHKLADLLAKSDPDAARALRQAANQAQRALIAEDMAEVIRHLQKGLANPALEKQEEIIGDLKKVLDALRRGEFKLDDRRRYLDDLKKFLAKVDQLIQKEEKLEARSRFHADAKRIDQQMQDLAARLDGLVAGQKKLHDQTLQAGGGDPPLGELIRLRDRVRKAIADQQRINDATKVAPIERLPVAGTLQDRLGKRTDSLAKDVAAAGKNKDLTDALARAGAEPKALGGAGESVGRAGEEMKRAASDLSQSEPSKAQLPQQQALTELGDAEKALSAAVKKMLNSSPVGHLAKQQEELEKKASGLAEDVRKVADQTGLKPDVPRPAENISRAAGQMGQAAEGLAKQQMAKAAGHQKKALKELKDNKLKLAQLHRRMKEKAAKPLAPEKDRQDRVAEDTRQVGKEMDLSAEDRKPSRPTPGRQCVGKAGERMGKASEKLGGGKAGQANEEQKQAIEELKKAREDIEEEIAREEERIREEDLARIDQMLARMLKAQKNLSAETRAMGRRLAEIAPADAAEARAAALKIAELSKGEGRLAEDARRVIEMLRKEGSTFVFPEILEEVRGDLGDVEKRLDRKQCGPLTQGIQREVEQNLQEMIDAIRKTLADRKQESSGGGGKGGGGGGKAPLVSNVAELKMLRVLQLQVNGRGRILDQAKKLRSLSAEQVEKQYDTLVRRERKVKAMTRKLAEKSEKSQAPIRRAGGS